MFAKSFSQMKNGRSAKDYFRLVGIVLLGFFLLPLLVRSAAQEHAPQSVIALQLLIGSLGLLFAHLATKGNFTFSKPEWLHVIAMSVLGVTLYRVLSRYALTVAMSSSLSNLGVLVMLTTTPVLLCVLYAVLKPYSVTRWSWIAAFLSLIGVLVSFRSLNLSWNEKTILLSLTAALALAGYTLLSEFLLKKHSVLKVVAVSTSLGTLLILALSFGSLMQQDWGNIGWWSLLTPGFFTIGFGYMVWNYAIQRIGGLHTTIYANLAVVFSGYVAYLMSALFSAVLGMTLLIISAALIHKKHLQNHREQPNK